MLTLQDIQHDKNLIEAIDWDMTPEEAVRLYLEWGNNWAGGRYVIRSAQDVSHYFVLNTWGQKPIIYLVRRSSEEAVELGEIRLPEELEEYCRKEYGGLKGVFALEGDLKQWLQDQVGAA